MPLFTKDDATKLLTRYKGTHFDGTVRFLCDEDLETKCPNTFWALYYHFDSIRVLPHDSPELDDIQAALQTALEYNKASQNSSSLAAKLVEFIGSKCGEINLCPASGELVKSCVASWMQRPPQNDAFSDTLNIVNSDNLQQEYPKFYAFLTENLFCIKHLTSSGCSSEVMTTMGWLALGTDLPDRDEKSIKAIVNQVIEMLSSTRRDVSVLDDRSPSPSPSHDDSEAKSKVLHKDSNSDVCDIGDVDLGLSS